MVKVSLEKQESNKISLAVEVEPEQVATTYEKVFRRVANQVTIPGFRKGKAPRQMVERVVDQDLLRQETLEKILPQAYAQAISESQLDPITFPQVEIVQFEQDQPLIFKAVVEIRPEVSLGPYQGVAVSTPRIGVRDEQVQERLEKLRERYVQLKAVEERSLQLGDVAVIDYDSTVEGAAEPERQSGFQAVIDPQHVYKGFAERLVGMQAGETREFSITFPGDYALERLRDKTVQYKVALKSLKERIFPPIDDQLAQMVGEFSSLQELKDAIHKDLESAAEDQHQANVQLAVVEQVVNNAAVEIPDTMIQREVQVLWRQAVDRLKSQGMEVPPAMYQLPKDEKALENLKQEASRRIKTSLVLGAISRAEKIELTEEEIATEIGAFARENNVSVEVIRKQLERENRMARLIDELLSLKVINWLVERAKVTVTEPTAEPVSASTAPETEVPSGS